MAAWRRSLRSLEAVLGGGEQSQRATRHHTRRLGREKVITAEGRQTAQKNQSGGSGTGLNRDIDRVVKTTQMVAAAHPQTGVSSLRASLSARNASMGRRRTHCWTHDVALDSQDTWRHVKCLPQLVMCRVCPPEAGLRTPAQIGWPGDAWCGGLGSGALLLPPLQRLGWPSRWGQCWAAGGAGWYWSRYTGHCTDYTCSGSRRKGLLGRGKPPRFLPTRHIL